MILSGRFLKSLRFLTVKHPTEIYFRYWWQMTQAMFKYEVKNINLNLKF